MNSPLIDYHVLITGATGTIGKALSYAFAKEGARLCLLGRDKEKLNSLGKELSSHFGTSFSTWTVDLSEKEELVKTLKEIHEKKGCLDVVVNNGGIVRDSLSFRMTDDDWSHVIDVNLSSAFYISREASKMMIKKRVKGRIINITSIIGFSGNVGQANYAASKAGLLGLTKAMALEVARWGITVNAIAPGYIASEMTASLDPSFTERIPCGRQGTPEEVAYGALFLSNPKASYITGQTLHINGGLGMYS